MTQNDIKFLKIALTGKARSGKDTVANYLIEKYGMVAFAFGDGLKSEFHAKYTHIPMYPKPVRGYQLYGQLQRYVRGDDVWVDKCFSVIDTTEKIAHGYTQGTGIPRFRPLITDIRQHNEVERCIQEGYTVIKVEAPEDTRIERMKQAGDSFNKAVFSFETETTVDEFEIPIVIHNNDTIESLKRKVDEVVQGIIPEADSIL